MPYLTRTLNVTRVERLASSRNGNPAYRLTFSDGTNARTKPDAGFVFGLPSPSRMEGSRYDVVTDGNGHLVDLEQPTS